MHCPVTPTCVGSSVVALWLLLVACCLGWSAGELLFLFVTPKKSENEEGNREPPKLPCSRLAASRFDLSFASYHTLISSTSCTLHLH